MRKSICFLLLLSLVLQCLGSLGVFAWFQANKPYIAQYLCENKERPWLACEGQCVLMKKLHQMEEQQQQKPSGAKLGPDKTEWHSLLPFELPLLLSCEQELLRAPLPPYIPLIPEGIHDLLFQPPRWGYPL